MTPEMLDQWSAWLWEPAPFTTAPRVAVLGLLLGLVLVVVATIFIFAPWARRWWKDETPGENEDERGVSTVEMTLVEHLLELRTRLIWSVATLAVTTIVAFVFYRVWFNIAVWPVRGRGDCVPPPGVAEADKLCLQAITPTELVFAYFMVTLVVGLIVAMPVIAYQAWAYIAPGLTRQERRYVLALVPGVTASFIAGVAFAHLALMPAALGFLFAFGSGEVEVKSTVAAYISFTTRLLIAIGLVFQLPVVLFFLAKVHLINPKMLSSIRRYVVVAAFILAAVVTPTPDPFNQLLVVVPILVLYEVGALLARIA